MARPVDRPDIATTDDIARLVRRFYAVALVDDLLGPIFAAAGLDVDVHLPRIAAFWERQLLDLPNYQGNMVRVHLETHDRTPLDGAAFERWLALWDDAVDDEFAGPVATLAKARARGAAQTLQASIARRSLPFVE
jgi:hemoglobin